MKKLAKNLIVKILGWQVRRLSKKYKFITIGVVGSIGKTSTKFAIARVLSQAKSVRWQEGNYNDIVSVPLIFFGEQMPSLFNPLAWLKIFWRNEKQISKKFPFDAVVVELGTDGPGQIVEFKKYLNLDYAVITAITPEHMEYFADLDAVAREELIVSTLSEQLLLNADLCEQKYFGDFKPAPITYGANNKPDYLISDIQFKNDSAAFNINSSANRFSLSATMPAVSRAELYSATIAAIISNKLGLSPAEIKAGVSKLRPVAGRMQRLKGIKNSLIIDETYNASPAAVIAALDSLYSLNAPQKIAILGNMNELGKISESSHREIGEYCQPSQIDLVVTIGPDANKFTAEEAKKNGCQVATFNDPYSAGEFVRNRLKNGALILAKGSQNGVFAEEAVKLLLRNSEDEKLLVRQTTEWLNKKAKNFSG